MLGSASTASIFFFIPGKLSRAAAYPIFTHPMTLYKAKSAYVTLEPYIQPDVVLKISFSKIPRNFVEEFRFSVSRPLQLSLPHLFHSELLIAPEKGPR